MKNVGEMCQFLLLRYHDKWTFFSHNKSYAMIFSYRSANYTFKHIVLNDGVKLTSVIPISVTGRFKKIVRKQIDCGM